jgi:acyl-CoA dehydrogenase
MAVTEKGKGSKGVSSFIVEKGTTGLAFGKRERPMGLPHHTREVFFEDCEIPRGNLIDAKEKGSKLR